VNTVLYIFCILISFICEGLERLKIMPANNSHAFDSNLYALIGMGYSRECCIWCKEALVLLPWISYEVSHFQRAMQDICLHILWTTSDPNGENISMSKANYTVKRTLIIQTRLLKTFQIIHDDDMCFEVF
jgi:hypothetical protein